MTEAPANRYDELPYTDLVFSETHPDQVAAMAVLFGHSPPPPRGCRVLELGCSNGSNLFPMAEMLPESRFVGIDLSARQIARGREAIARIGLTNVALESMSILDVDADFGTFDYILCHGVYSWVPAPVRDKILAICARHLAPEGIAYISFNTFPGWHLRGVIRDMMNFHVAPYEDARLRVRMARSFLDFLARSTPDRTGPYAHVLRSELEWLDLSDDTHLYHEHLEEVNHPVYFHEFVAHAEGHGLAYLGPARFEVIDACLSAEATRTLDQLSGERIRREQYLDFLCNRSLRKSLLCRSGAVAHPSLTAEALHRLRFAALASPESSNPDVCSETPEVFRSPAGDRIAPSQPLLKAALLALFSAWPRSLTFDQLLDAAGQERLGRKSIGDRGVLAAALIPCLQANCVALHCDEPPIALTVSRRPKASGVARDQAAMGGAVVNQRLRSLFLPEFDRRLIQLLDGSRGVEGLRATLKSGQVDPGAPASGHSAGEDAALNGRLEEGLQMLAAQAFLVA